MLPCDITSHAQAKAPDTHLSRFSRQSNVCRTEKLLENNLMNGDHIKDVNGTCEREIWNKRCWEDDEHICRCSWCYDGQVSLSLYEVQMTIAADPQLNLNTHLKKYTIIIDSTVEQYTRTGSHEDDCENFKYLTCKKTYWSDLSKFLRRLEQR